MSVHMSRLMYVISVVGLSCLVWANGRALFHALQGYSERPLDSYSYLESDFPHSLIPLSKYPYNSCMTVEDTTHYSPNASDEAEWWSLFPRGSKGYVRLGPEQRPFSISMYRQIRCLMKMQRAVFEEPPTEEAKWEVSHCMNHIRQMLLCASSTKLEPFVPDPEMGLEKVDGLLLDHTCRDWTVLRELAEDNYAAWPEQPA